jgi:glycyl-tRNA synthetase beta chain
VRPRLTDAEFFFKQDKKQPLEDFNERLQERGVPGKARQRLRQGRARFQTGRLHRPAHRRQRRARGRAGLLSKCDLATEMVGEFPEMQGVAGYYYALNDGEPEDVALALNEQYMPRGAGAELPQTLTGAAVAIADKLDTLVGIFGIGMLPTGSKTRTPCAVPPWACCAS